HQIGANNLNSHFAIKGRALMSQVDFTHTTNIDTPNQIVITEVVQLLPANRQTMLFFHLFVFFGSRQNVNAVGGTLFPYNEEKNTNITLYLFMSSIAPKGKIVKSE